MTGKAAIGRPADAYALADIQAFGVLAKGGDCSYGFVARHERKLGHAPLVVEHGEVGVTDSAMADLNLDFFRPKCTRVEGEWFKRGMGCGGRVSVKLGRHRIRQVPDLPDADETDRSHLFCVRAP